MHLYFNKAAELFSFYLCFSLSFLTRLMILAIHIRRTMKARLGHVMWRQYENEDESRWNELQPREPLSPFSPLFFQPFASFIVVSTWHSCCNWCTNAFCPMYIASTPKIKNKISFKMFMQSDTRDKSFQSWNYCWCKNFCILYL